MRSLVALGGTVLLLASLAGSALGADHVRINEVGTDDDFCGTGASVDYSVKGHINLFENKITGGTRTTLTNPLTGASIIDSVAGQVRFERVDGADGAYTFLEIRVGSPEKLKLAHGEVLTMDVGNLVIAHHFDADDNYLGSELVKLSGPHPDFESDFTLWCELALEALGL